MSRNGCGYDWQSNLCSSRSTTKRRHSTGKRDSDLFLATLGLGHWQSSVRERNSCRTSDTKLRMGNQCGRARGLPIAIRRPATGWYFHADQRGWNVVCAWEYRRVELERLRVRSECGRAVRQRKQSAFQGALDSSRRFRPARQADQRAHLGTRRIWTTVRGATQCSGVRCSRPSSSLAFPRRGEH